MVEELASYRNCITRINACWRAFLQKRADRLKPQGHFGAVAERVAENILEDLFTIVLDWAISDINYQVGYTDMVITRLGVKYLIIEAKRPGALAWNRRAVEIALDQALRYASEQKVKCIGVSDGMMLYAADVEHGGLHDRVFVSLEDTEPPEALWWLSVHGIYRPRQECQDAALHLLPEIAQEQMVEAAPVSGVLLHPKYNIPAHCFAYVGQADDPTTWKLPYRLADGSIDLKRLPKAIQAILSNYRGAKVSSIPEADIPQVLVRLGQAAARLGRMPHQSGKPTAIYQQLADALEQVGRLDEIAKVLSK
jgi:hypothetical protein